MRSLRCSMTVFCWFLGLVPTAVGAQSAPPAPSDLLRYRPTLPGVDYDTPADPAAINACKVEMVVKEQKSIGYALRDGQGRLLRRFVDSDGNHKLDQWSYYQDGFEVYRERNLDGNGSLDEVRWLNAGGTRVGTVERGQVASWKQLSAEEASKVFVQGLVQAMDNGDLALLETVMATSAELSAAGVPKDVVAKMSEASAARAEKVAALVKTLTGWNRQTIWNRFDGTFPHVIPADAGSGLEKDVIVYENAMIFPGSAAAANANAATSKVAFLQIPDMIQLGATWKFIELPMAVDPEKPVVASVSGIRALLFDRANNVQPRDEVVDAALKALADYDARNAALLQSGQERDTAKYHVGRIGHLQAVAKALKNDDDKLSYNKQVIDSLVAALRSGAYPQGRPVLEKRIEMGGKLGSYAAFSLIGAEFALRNNAPGANVLANQKKWMGDLENFLAKFPQADEAPDVLLQLAIANEFNADEEPARKQYAQVIKDYPGTEAAKKAAGSLRRLDLVGKPLGLKGTGLQNESIDSSQYQGKPLLVVFWASWATPVKDNLPELIKVQEKYRDRGLEVIGVNLDNERAELEAFLKAHQLTWPQIFEGGGMESRLAVEFGIISLPSMILVDAQGKVVDRHLRTAAEVERQLEKLLAQRPAGGVALDRRD